MCVGWTKKKLISVCMVDEGGGRKQCVWVCVWGDGGGGGAKEELMCVCV